MDFGFVAIDRYDSTMGEMKRRDRCTRSMSFTWWVHTLAVRWLGLYSFAPASFGDSALVVGLLSFAGLLRSVSVPVHAG